MAVAFEILQFGGMQRSMFCQLSVKLATKQAMLFSGMTAAKRP